MLVKDTIKILETRAPNSMMTEVSWVYVHWCESVGLENGGGGGVVRKEKVG